MVGPMIPPISEDAAKYKEVISKSTVCMTNACMEYHSLQILLVLRKSVCQIFWFSLSGPPGHAIYGNEAAKKT